MQHITSQKYKFSQRKKNKKKFFFDWWSELTGGPTYKRIYRRICYRCLNVSGIPSGVKKKGAILFLFSVAQLHICKICNIAYFRVNLSWLGSWLRYAQYSQVWQNSNRAHASSRYTEALGQ